MEQTSGDQWLSDVEQRAWRAVLVLRGELMADLGRRLSQESGLSLPDYDVLVQLSESSSGVVLVRDLLLALNWEASRLSHQLTRMQGRGLLTRRASLQDGRRSEVELTPAGRAAIDRAAPGHVTAVRELFINRLDPSQLQVLAQVATAVTQPQKLPPRSEPLAIGSLAAAGRRP